MNASPCGTVLAVAPNGAYKSQRDHPALPITPREIARTAHACNEAGAAMIHLHVRDKDGRHSLDPDSYRAAVDATRREVADRMIIQVTSEAVDRYSTLAQIDAMKALRPRSVSLALREFLTGACDSESVDFFHWLSREKILPQFILYDVDELSRYISLSASGNIPDTPHWLLFVLGRYVDGQVSSPSMLIPFLTLIDKISVPWAVCAFGSSELACTLAATLHGGHARIGFENNLLNVEGSVATSNEEQIKAFADVVDSLNIRLSGADEFRNLFDGWG
ncbi:MAG: 3-keto-5-aminohexanoate cleavage protein [Pseudomonadota bacterium]